MGHDKDTYIGYVEMATGLGDMIGPAMGGIVYQWYGFTGTFFAFSSMVAIGILVSIIMISNKLNERKTYISPESSES
jgi:predicted MFS family arabinose efflux permease